MGGLVWLDGCSLPEGTTLEEVWQTLVAMHEGESDVLGLLHSLGYVRGLQNALDMPEQRRVEILVEAATTARVAAMKPGCLGSMRLGLELRFNALCARRAAPASARATIRTSASAPLSALAAPPRRLSAPPLTARGARRPPLTPGSHPTATVQA